MPSVEIVGFLDPLAIFESIEDAESWLSQAERLVRGLRSTALKQWPVALALVEHWYPDIGIPTQRALAGAISWRLNHALDRVAGEA